MSYIEIPADRFSGDVNLHRVLNFVVDTSNVAQPRFLVAPCRDGWYRLPGGFQKLKEEPSETAARAMFETTGIKPNKKALRRLSLGFVTEINGRYVYITSYFTERYPYIGLNDLHRNPSMLGPWLFITVDTAKGLVQKRKLFPPLLSEINANISRWRTNEREIVDDSHTVHFEEQI